MSKTLTTRFRVAPGKRVQLAKIDPRDQSAFADREAAEQQSKEDGKAINVWQDKLFAEGKRALLVILQGTDTSGKDGTIRHVFKETGSLGMTVTSFRRPSEEERRTISSGACISPVRGAASSASSTARSTRTCWWDACASWRRSRRSTPATSRSMRSKKCLSENGTTILKFMLHISKKEQGERLQERLDDPDKRWKFDPRDLEERKLWDRVSDGLRADAQQVLDGMGAVVRDPGRSQVGAQRSHCHDRARDAGSHEPGVSATGLEPEGLQGGVMTQAAMGAHRLERSDA